MRSKIFLFFSLLFFFSYSFVVFADEDVPVTTLDSSSVSENVVKKVESNQKNDIQADVVVDEAFTRAKVIEVGDRITGSDDSFFASELPLKIEFIDGLSRGKVTDINYSLGSNVKDDKLPVSVGDILVIAHSNANGKSMIYVYEPYRLNPLIILSLLFAALVVFVAGKKGFSSLFALFVTLLILLKVILPLIIAGHNPVYVCFAGSFLIAAASIYLGHGFNKKISLALFATLITLLIAFVLSLVSVSWAHLFGTGSEAALSLTFTKLSNIDLKGLLLGAIVIGTLGILDDVTTTQIATIDEIRKADPNLGFSDLYNRGLIVGKEHIAALVNTLLIAYVGAFFPVFLLIANSKRPFWVIANNEALAEEIVRTLVGSMTLVLAVPISTFIGAYYYSKFKSKK